MNDAIDRALHFLADAQMPHGELRTFASPDRAMGDEVAYESSPFVSSVAAAALEGVDDPRAATIVRRVAAFLVDEMEPPGLWRWYTSRHPQQVIWDLDDVVCASAVLKTRHPYIAMGWNHDWILRRRRAADGLFQTWYGRDDADNDVDCVVNANTVWYLGESAATEPVCAWLNTLVTDGAEASLHRYYVGEGWLYHAVSRAMLSGVRALRSSADAAVARLRNATPGNAMDEALRLSALHRYGERDAAAVVRLLAAQGDDGSWPCFAAYTVAQREDGRRWYWGSAELTTALAIEALAGV